MQTQQGDAANTVDYPGAIWRPLPSTNYEAGRLAGPVTEIVVHTTEGRDAAGAIQTLLDDGLSAHYLIDATSGTAIIYQLVSESNTAYHAGNLAHNRRSVGIEHVGMLAEPARYFTPVLLAASAHLVSDICRRHAIQPSHIGSSPGATGTILGHIDVPDPFHVGQWGGESHHPDPGPSWPWAEYLQLITGGSTVNGHFVPADFLAYYNAHGGLPIFGYPRSEVMQYAGMAVQWFERARFERHPNGVQLGLVGNEAAVAVGIHLS